MDGRGKISLIVVLATWVATGCTAPRFDGCTLTGKSAIIDEVNKALNSENCATAIAQIEGVFNSECTGNEVRYARAAAQACAAGMSNAFSFVGKLAENSASLAGPTFWNVMSRLFYSADTDALDTRVTAGWNATDALLAMTTVGAVIATANQVNEDSYNVGSTLYSDRTSDSNAYLVFVSMAMIGAIQNRYATPDTTNYSPTQIMGATVANPDGWAVATSVDETACSYASSVVNMLDGINAISNVVTGSLKNTLVAISTQFSSLINDACDYGCQGFDTVVDADYSITGCAMAAGTCAGTSSAPCLRALRDRTSCTGFASNQATCAAAGIHKFIQSSAGGWQ